jgi:hypothetical protein
MALVRKRWWNIPATGFPYEGGNDKSLWKEHCPLLFYLLWDEDEG